MELNPTTTWALFTAVNTSACFHSAFLPENWQVLVRKQETRIKYLAQISDSGQDSAHHRPRWSLCTLYTEPLVRAMTLNASGRRLLLCSRRAKGSFSGTSECQCGSGCCCQGRLRLLQGQPLPLEREDCLLEAAKRKFHSGQLFLLPLQFSAPLCHVSPFSLAQQGFYAPDPLFPEQPNSACTAEKPCSEHHTKLK